jgi:hypothetical protein
MTMRHEREPSSEPSYGVAPELILTIAVDPVPSENGHRDRIGHAETATWGHDICKTLGISRATFYQAIRVR